MCACQALMVFTIDCIHGYMRTMWYSKDEKTVERILNPDLDTQWQMIFYNFNQNAVTFVEGLKRKTSCEKHYSLAFKNTKMSALPKHLHWT